MKPDAVSFALGKLVDIEGFGWMEADRVQRSPPLACLD